MKTMRAAARLATCSLMASAPCVAWQTGNVQSSMMRWPPKTRRLRPLGGRYSNAAKRDHVREHYVGSSTALPSIMSTIGSLGNMMSGDPLTTGVEIVVAAGMLWALVWSMNPDTTSSSKNADTKEEPIPAKKANLSPPKETKKQSSNEGDKESLFEDAVFAAAAELQDRLNDVKEMQAAGQMAVEDDLDNEAQSQLISEEEIALAEAMAEPAPDAPAVGIVPSIDTQSFETTTASSVPMQGLDVKSALRQQAQEEELEDEEERTNELRQILQRKASQQTIARMEQTSTYLSSLGTEQRATPTIRSGSMTRGKPPPSRDNSTREKPAFSGIMTRGKTKTATPKQEAKTATKEQLPREAPKRSAKAAKKGKSSGEPKQPKSARTAKKSKLPTRAIPAAKVQPAPKAAKKQIKGLKTTEITAPRNKEEEELEEEESQGLAPNDDRIMQTFRDFLKKRRSLIIGVFVVVLGRRLILTWLGRGMI